MAVQQEILFLGFENNFTDGIGRHTFTNSGVTFSTDCKVDAASAYFSGSSYLQATDNLIDFNLGATLTYTNFSSNGWSSTFADNNFTIDCWVKPEVGGARFYPICASGQVYFFGGGYKVGWSLQIDTATGKLQMIGYAGGDWSGSLYESSFTIPFGQWTYIAVMSWLLPAGSGTPSAKAMYKNGDPELDGWSTLSAYMTWGNSMGSGGVVQSAPFNVGRGPRSQYTNPGQAWGVDVNLDPGYFFKGWIDNLRICLGSRFPNGESLTQVVSFTPPGITSTTSTTTTTTLTTTVSTTTTTVTTLSTTTLSTSTLTTFTTASTTTISTTAPPFPVIPDGSTNESIEDCVPEMTSDVSPVPFIITASSENLPGQGVAPPWSPAYYAFDDNQVTPGILPHYWRVALKDATTFPQWIKVDFGEGHIKAINKYRLCACNLVGFPKNWKLQASANNHNWVDLHSIENFPISQIDYFEGESRPDLVSYYNRWLNATNTTWVQSQVWWTHWFTFSNEIFYRFYRFYVDVLFTTTNQQFPQLSISQIEIVEAEPFGSTTATTTGSTTVSTTTWTSTTQPPYYKNVTNGGYASVSHEYPNCEAALAFDREIGTYWACDPYSGPPYWIVYYWLDRAYAVDCYQIYATTKGGPTDWIFQGSSDGESWTDLDTRTNVIVNKLWTGYILNYTPYSFYRIYILGTQSQAFGTRIDDIQFYINSKDYVPESQMHWIGYDFTPKQVNVGYYCVNLKDGQGFRKWKIQGSDDGILWTDIDFQEQPDFVGWKCFEITGNQQSFLKWRLLILDWVSGSQPGIVELELYSVP